MPPQFDFKHQYGDILIIWAAIISMVGFVLGATFVGAEWSSGSMMNLLTWRPKRMNVLGYQTRRVAGLDDRGGRRHLRAVDGRALRGRQDLG
jgi:hypothetical protein